MKTRNAEPEVTKREIWTFEPSEDVKALVTKKINSLVGRNATKRQKFGLRSRILKECILTHLADLRGKRDAKAA